MITWMIMLVKALKVNARIYQVHDPELMPCALILKLLGKKVIFDLHENVAEDIFDKPWIRNKKLLYRLFGMFEKRVVRKMKLFLAETSYEDRYINMQADFTTVLNYPDLSFFEPFVNLRRTGNRVFYIGILLESRGLLEIAEALWILKQRGINVEFDVVGELYTELAQKLDELTFIEKIRSQIHFHGRLALEQGYELSRNAAVGMCIIHPMKNSVGSYPTKMFEYMAIGLPQVISNFPLYKSVVEKHQCGIAVNPMNPLEIADGIENILRHPEKSASMSKNGVDNARQYHWETQFSKVLEVYRALE